MTDRNRFVAFAFCVGDAFFTLDPDLRIRHAEGALDWLGLGSAVKAVNRPFTAFLDDGDLSAFSVAVGNLKDIGRLGPLRLRLGAEPAARKSVGLFLSRMAGDNRIQIVVMAGSRLEPPAEQAASLPDSDAFLNRMSDVLSDSADGSQLSISLLALSEAESPADPDTFARLLSGVSLGGHSAADLGAGRYAVLHEKGGGDVIKRIGQATGERLESVSLSPGEAASGQADAVRALVYAIREYADSDDPPDLKTLASSFSKNMTGIRRRIGDLRKLLKEKRYAVAYQPILALATGEVHHHEALARFDARGGSPYELISFAEDVGLIAEFDASMMETVIRAMRKEAHAGNPLSVAVNLSARSLVSVAFQESLAHDLERLRAPKDRLLLEVTESAQVKNLSALAGAVDRLRDDGYRVCLDDFGAGASGFQYLKHVRSDFVKIDGSYVRDADSDPEKRAFLQSMTTLCRELGIATIAEWIETPAQAELMLSLGVDMGQGYYYGRPALALPKPDKSARVGGAGR